MRSCEASSFIPPRCHRVLGVDRRACSIRPEDDNIPLRSYFPSVHDPDFFTKMPLDMGLQDPFTFFTYSGDTVRRQKCRARTAKS